MNKNKLILFDIDYTLINTDILRKEIGNTLINLIKCDKKTYTNAQEVYTKTLKSSTDFNPANYCLFLAKQFNKDKKLLLKAFYNNEKLYKKSIYKDVISTLEILKYKHALGVFSEGIKIFQLIKLNNSQLIKYFDKKHLYIFKRKTSDISLSKIPMDSLIIDDNKSVVEILNSYKVKFETIWINRNLRKSNSLLQLLSTHL